MKSSSPSKRYSFAPSFCRAVCWTRVHGLRSLGKHYRGRRCSHLRAYLSNFRHLCDMELTRLSYTQTTKFRKAGPQGRANARLLRSHAKPLLTGSSSSTVVVMLCCTMHACVYSS